MPATAVDHSGLCHVRKWHNIGSLAMRLPKPLSGHLANSIHVAHIATQADELNSDRRSLLDHISCVVRVLGRSGIWVVSHIRWQMLESVNLDGLPGPSLAYHF
jgi:hypothetical protein